MSEHFRPEQKGAWLALRDIALIVPRIFRYLWEVAPAMLAIQGVSHWDTHHRGGLNILRGGQVNNVGEHARRERTATMR